MISSPDKQEISHVSEPKGRRYLLCHLQKAEKRLRIIKSLKLENTSKIRKSNFQLTLIH